MRRRVLLYLTLIAVSACNGDKLVQPNASPTSPTNAISDATHGAIAGNPDFFFLPPMVANPSGSPKWDAGAFNPNLRPTVAICASAALTEATVASAACTPLLPSLTATVDAAEEQYHVNWQVPSSSTIFYRISVNVGTKQLGFADVETGSTGSQLKNVSTGDFIPLVDGRTLPIKFRIEKYALCETPGDPSKPCTSASVNLGTGGTVQAALTPNSPDQSGVIVPAQPTNNDVAVTIARCESFNPRVTDLPVFGPCVRVTIDPALTAPLQVPATVFSCEVFEQSVAGGVTGSAQAERIALHELNQQSGTSLRALGHADPTCATPTTHLGLGASLKHTMVALAHGRVSVAARQIAAMLSPKPAYAAMRFIDLGGGGFTAFGDAAGGSDRIPTSSARLSISAEAAPLTTIRDFQFALPAKFEFTTAQTSLTADPGTALDITVRITDLGGQPVRNARVHFLSSAGSSVSDAEVNATTGDGLATVHWQLSGIPGRNTLVASGRGIGGSDYNGPREGVDPFQPLQTHWGDDVTSSAPVLLQPGSVTYSAVTAGSVSGTVISDADGAAIVGATITIGTASTTSAAGGAFSIPGLAPGTYSVSASADGFLTSAREGVVVTAGSDNALGAIRLKRADVQITLNATSVEKLPGGTHHFVVQAGGAGPYLWSVNGTDGGSAAFGLIITNPDFSADYTAPALVPEPPTFDVCARRAANPTNKACAAVTIRPIPSSGQDVIVFNDVDFFDNTAAANPNNIRLFTNLVDYSGAGPRAAQRGVMIHLGHGSLLSCCGGAAFIQTLIDTYSNRGNPVNLVTNAAATITALPADIKLLYLVLPGSAYSDNEINILKQFAAEGGRIVFIGEHGGFYPTQIVQVENPFFQKMGAQLTNTGALIDCGYNTLPLASLRPHQVTEGMANVTMGCASKITLGPNDYALVYGSDGQSIIAAVAKIDVTPLPAAVAATFMRQPAARTSTADVDLDPVGMKYVVPKP